MLILIYQPWKAFLICLAVFSCGSTVIGESRSVLLQEDGEASPDSGLTWKKSLPTLTSFTFCLRLYSFRTRYSDYFFSHAVEGSDNELAFHLKYSKQELRMACCDGNIFLIIPTKLNPLVWFSFCAAVDLSSATSTFVHSYGSDFRNLTKRKKDYQQPLTVRGGGTVIFGQDQDEPGGGTDKGQSFNGLLSDLYLTKDVLTPQQMEHYLECKIEALLARPHIMDFEDVTGDFELGVKTAVKNGISSCPANNKIFSIFAEGRDFEEASRFCSVLSGNVALPINKQENIALLDESYKSADECTVYDKSNSMWVSVIWETEMQKWIDTIRDKEASYKSFETDFNPVSDTILCVIAQNISTPQEAIHEGNWDIENCNRKLCTACEFESQRPLRVRGLCAESLFDREYYIYDQINMRPVFNGKSWTKIVWTKNQSDDENGWTMYQISKPSVHAKMIAKSELVYPIGVHDFEVLGDKCPEKEVRLKLTSCPRGMYTCSDGICIDIKKRCNLELDCADHSDELNCGTLMLRPGYEKRLPPPKINSFTPAQISTNCNIRLIRKFSLLESQLVVDIFLSRSWHDSRVRYKNLHNDSNLNLIDDFTEVIWYPDMTMLGSDNSYATVSLLKSSGWAKRVTEPDPDDDQLIDEDVFYSGGLNPLVFDREFTITLICTFDLALYPFDTQRCPMVLFVGDFTHHYVNTTLNKLIFSGERRLLEYQVTNVQHSPFLYQNKSAQQIHIVLTNLYGYYISGAYVPTLLLVIISYLTFYFTLEDFTNRVMVSLTSLLVLAALFAQIASGLPKTAYMKLIDVWFIFCILSDFVMVISLVAIDAILQNENPVLKIFCPLCFKNKLEKKSLWQRLDAKLCNRIAQVVLPIMMGIFIFIYFCRVVYSLSSVNRSNF